jgi:hypothetical protein
MAQIGANDLQWFVQCALFACCGLVLLTRRVIVLPFFHIYPIVFIANRRKIRCASLHAVVENRYLCKLLRSA